MLHITRSQKKKKWISDDTYAVIREKREAKGKDKNRYQELKAEIQRKLIYDSLHGVYVSTALHQ